MSQLFPPELTVLLVEDDDRLARFTVEFLEQNRVSVKRFADGVSALSEALRTSYDVIVLDLMLPGRDGLSVCREIRQRSSVPVLMVTALSDEVDRLIGLELGADDYVTKPFSARELLARIRAVVRRTRGQVGPTTSSIRVGPLEIIPSSMRVTMRGKQVDVTSYEFSILQVLAERRGRVLSREQILDLAKGNAEDAFDRSIDVRISRLRSKLGDSARNAPLIRTVRGKGYVLTWESDR